MAISDYRCPPLFDVAGSPIKSDRKIGWMREALQQGRTFLESQRAYEDFQESMDKISGLHDDRIPKARSRIYVNRLKRQVREIVATESQLRPQWGFKTDNMKQFGEQVEILNRLHNSWWHSTFADRKVRQAMQYASVLGTGYVSPIWERDFWCAGRGDITLHVYGPTDVIPVQLPRDHDLQKAYAVAISTEVPLAAAHAMYPTLADKIKATKERPGWLRKGVQKIRRFMAPALNVGGPRQRQVEDAIFPVVDMYHIYIMDLSVNTTGKTLVLGKPGSNWQYEVPYLGQEIPTGYNTPEGKPTYRKAEREDCLLFPQRRLMIATDDFVIDDDASPWWHGKVPLVKFTTDDWPWEFLGFSAMRDTHGLQFGINELLRQIQDSGNARLRPVLQHDSNAVPQEVMKQIDTRSPGGTLEVNTALGDFVKPLLPADYYNVPTFIPEHIERLERMMDFILAVNDLSSIAKAGQIPASESIEKLMQLAGPIVQDISRNMEKPLGELCEMNKGLFFQFYNTKRRISLLGPGGTTDDDWDYDPGNLVPDWLPGKTGTERARYHQQNFVSHVTPHSAHQVTQMTWKMLYLQLWRGGFPIDPWTVADALDIPNFGAAPASTVFDRWNAWNEIQAKRAIAMQAAAASVTAAAEQGAAPASGPTGAPEGRPPSGQVPPHLVMKDGGSRSTIAES